MVVTTRTISRSISVVATLAFTTLGIIGASYASPVSLLASKDAYIRSGTNGNRNYGADSYLQVKYADGNVNSANNSRKSYTQFDLSSVTPASLTSATLSLTVGDAVIGGDDGTTVYNFHVYGLTDGASENFNEGTGTTAVPTAGGVTFNNAPFNNATPNAITGGVDVGTFSLTGRGTAGQVISLNSAALLNFIQGDTNSIVGFAIVRDTPELASFDVVHTFASKERGGTFAGPTLTVDSVSASVPEASALVLIAPALGLLGVVMTARKSRKA